MTQQMIPKHVTYDVRERLSESLHRIVVASDMLDALPLDLSLREYRSRAQRIPAIRRIFPIIPDRPSPQTVAAVVRRGAWVVQCPFCQGGEYADPAQPLFLCCSCWNQEAGGQPLRVLFPEDAATIEPILLKRPVAKHRRWQSGMTLEDMEADYLTAQVSGSPTDQVTGDLITSAIYNARVGSSGDLQYLWATHKHGGAAGDGAQFDFQSNSAVASAGWSPPDEAWTDVDSLSLTLTVASTCQFLYVASAFYTSDGLVSWRIRRTSGGGASLTTEYIRPAAASDGMITLAGRASGLAAGAHTISLQVYEQAGVEVNITFRDAVMLAVTEIS